MSTEGAFRLVIIDCIDMPFAYEMARAPGMAAVENLLRNMAAELRARLPLTGQLYAVAVGRFAYFTHNQMTLTLDNIALSLQGIQARISPEVPLDLDIHIGDSGLCDNAMTPNEILRRAVSALHEAISQRHRFMAYDEALDARKKSDFSLLTGLRQALHENQGLYLVYQPKISLLTGRVTGAEALLRWRHPENSEARQLSNTIESQRFTRAVKKNISWVAPILFAPANNNFDQKKLSSYVLCVDLVVYS